MQNLPRFIRDLASLQGYWILALVALFLGVGKSAAQDEIYGSGDFVLNEGPVYSDTGTWIGSCSVISLGTSNLSSSGWLNLLGISQGFTSGNDNLPHVIDVTATHGTVTKSPDQPVYDFNTQVTLTATPDPGYIFEKWTLNGGAIYRDRTINLINPTLTLMTVRDYDVVACFVPISRIIELRAVDLIWDQQAVGGSADGRFEIRNSGNSPLTVESIAFPTGFIGNWAGTIAPGSTQEITVTFAPTAAGTYSGDILVTSDATEGTATIPVSAVAQNAYLLTGASTFGESVTSATSRRYWHGAIVTLKAMPVAGYVFMNWTEDGEILSTEANFDLPISRGHKVWANYLPESRVLKISVKHGTRAGKLFGVYRGTISIENTGTLPVYLSNVQIEGRGIGDVLVSGLRSGWIAPGSMRKVKITTNTILKKSYRLRVTAVGTDLSSPVKPLVIKRTARGVSAF